MNCFEPAVDGIKDVSDISRRYKTSAIKIVSNTHVFSHPHLSSILMSELISESLPEGENNT